MGGSGNASDHPLSPLAVPLATRATPSSPTGSAGPPVSIAHTVPGAFPGLPPPGPRPWSSTNSLWSLGSAPHPPFCPDYVHLIPTFPANTNFASPDQQIVRCDERGSTGSSGEACLCKVCVSSRPDPGGPGFWPTARRRRRKEAASSPWLLGQWVVASAAGRWVWLARHPPPHEKWASIRKEQLVRSILV